PPAPNTNVYVSPGEPLNGSGQVLRSDRPPSAQHPAQIQQRLFSSDEPTHARDPAPAMPVYSFPSSPAETAARPAETVLRPPSGVSQGEMYRAVPTPALPAPAARAVPTPALA